MKYDFFGIKCFFPILVISVFSIGFMPKLFSISLFPIAFLLLLSSYFYFNKLKLFFKINFIILIFTTFGSLDYVFIHTDSPDNYDSPSNYNASMALSWFITIPISIITTLILAMVFTYFSQNEQPKTHNSPP